MEHSQMVRSVYRVVIREARRFPSIKRDSLVEEIRLEFRENITLADPAKIKIQVDLAIKGVSQLRAYTGMDQRDPNWAVRMEENPMPAPPEADTGTKLE
jgi:hypothetical protein